MQHVQKKVVQKFGGTSVGSIERIREVARLVAESSRHQQNIVVVSAMAGQTNRLVELAQQISPQPQPEAYDMLLASGEQVSCALLAMALSDLGLKPVPLLSFQAGIETDDLFNKARISHIRADRLQQHLDRGEIPVIAGFQGVRQMEGGRTAITTLGRGGSDTSAVAIAIAVEADRCDIFTDVEGVYTADPRLVPQARLLEKITFEEMMELASLGAKVLHMRSVELAAKHHLSLRVLSTFKPEGKGTTLMPVSQSSLESPVVSSITTDSAESLLSVRVPQREAQFPARLFRPLAEEGINVDVIVKTPPNEAGLCTLSLTVPRDEGRRAVEILEGLSYTAQLEQTSIVKLSIVGIGMRTHSGVAARMFETLEKLEVPIFLITTSEIKVSVLIDPKDREKAIAGLHEAFDLGQDG